MSDPFLAEIRIFSFNFAPKGWALCDGTLLPLNQNTALFALLGTNYGGDGRVTFALPNLQGSVPMFYQQGPGLSDYELGETGGSPMVTLLTSESPAHTHAMKVFSLADASSTYPEGQYVAKDYQVFGTANGPPPQNLAPQAMTVAGGSQPHNNMMPTLTMNFCIALQGVFPQRP